MDHRLARVRNLLHQQLDGVEDGRRVHVADHDQGRRADLVQALDRGRIQMLYRRALEVAVEVAAVHLQEQVAQRLPDIAFAAPRPVEPQAGLRAIYRVHVAGLVRGLDAGEELRVLLAEVLTADARTDEYELGDASRMLEREVDRHAAADRTADDVGRFEVELVDRKSTRLNSSHRCI